MLEARGADSQSEALAQNNSCDTFYFQKGCRGYNLSKDSLPEFATRNTLHRPSPTQASFLGPPKKSTVYDANFEQVLMGQFHTAQARAFVGSVYDPAFICSQGRKSPKISTPCFEPFVHPFPVQWMLTQTSKRTDWRQFGVEREPSSDSGESSSVT